MRLIEALNQSSSLPIVETLVDAPSSGDTLIEDAVDLIESLEPCSENIDECLGPNGPLALDFDLSSPSCIACSPPPLCDPHMGEACDFVHCFHESSTMCIYESPVFMPLEHDLPMLCDFAPLACETPYEVSCMPHTFESPIFVHYNPMYEPSDLEISAYIVDEAQVHAPCVSSVESPTMSLGHFDASYHPYSCSC